MTPRTLTEATSHEASDQIPTLPTCESAMDGPGDNNNTSTSKDPPPKVRFFDLILELTHIEVDPANVPACDPLQARPWKPHPLLQAHDTNMEWVLMGQPNIVFKPGKRKSSQRWVTTDRLRKDVFLRLEKNSGHKYVDSAGTIVAESDVWFIHGYSLPDYLSRLKTKKFAWDILAAEDARSKQEHHDIELRLWQQEFYNHLYQSGAVGSPRLVSDRKRKREEKEEKIHKAKKFLEECE